MSDKDFSEVVSLKISIGHLLVIWETLSNKLSGTDFIDNLDDVQKRALWALEDLCENVLIEHGISACPEEEWNNLVLKAKEYTKDIPVDFFESLFERVPESLMKLEANCGVVSVWLVLKQFYRHVEPEVLIDLCKHTVEFGTFMIALAVTLRRFDLRVSFHSDVDSDIQPIELVEYAEAKKLGLSILPAQSVNELRMALANGKQVIVFFNAKNGEGDISPIQSINQHEIHFECSEESSLSITEFESRRSANGICRQSIVVG